MPDAVSRGPFYYNDGITVVERPAHDSFGDVDDGRPAFVERSIKRVLPLKIESALRNLDEAFAGALLSDKFEACPCCYTDRDIEYLRTVRPCDMTSGDLFTITGSLTNTIGSACDIAYFVPAMLREQMLGESEDALVMRQLGRIVASDWTFERREALRALYQAYFVWRPLGNDDTYEPLDPAYRAWIAQMLERPPLSEAVERPIPGWDR